MLILNNSHQEQFLNLKILVYKTKVKLKRFFHVILLRTKQRLLILNCKEDCKIRHQKPIRIYGILDNYTCYH